MNTHCVVHRYVLMYEIASIIGVLIGVFITRASCLDISYLVTVDQLF